MAGSKTLILCLLVASAFIYLGSWRNPIDVKELVLWAGRFFLVLAVLTLIISLVIPWIPSSPVSRSNSSRTVPEDEMDQHQKLVRKEQQEQLSEKASSYIEKVMKPREELKLKKQEKRFYQMTGQSWKLTDGQKLGEVEDSVNNCSNVDTGVETANNEALRKRRLPEHATKHLPKAEQPQPKKVITLPEEPQELEEGQVLVLVGVSCQSEHNVSRLDQSGLAASHR
ncbi:UBX domain-containing protein 8 isoform X2 [Ascaphus truei]|uniref:UBX domain-containing protein 8 isoform X2 n=1 Tax=Ascaphus truei TaxID=8439 RepID=UPI003F5A9903